MDIRIGIAESPQVVEVELAESADRDEVLSRVQAALSDEDGVLHLVDHKGRDLLIPSSKISFAEVGSADAERRIGFGA